MIASSLPKVAGFAKAISMELEYNLHMPSSFTRKKGQTPSIWLMPSWRPSLPQNLVIGRALQTAIYSYGLVICGDDYGAERVATSFVTTPPDPLGHRRPELQRLERTDERSERSLARDR